LSELKGKTPTVRIAELVERNRYSVTRWLNGSVQPKLPDFLRLVDGSSRRLPDLVAAFVDPSRIPSVRDAWARLRLARQAAYDLFFSHGVLRALELRDIPRGTSAQRAFVARKLGITEDDVSKALQVLQATGQIQRTRTGYRPSKVEAVDTSHDPQRALALKAAWTETALERLRAGCPGQYGYSLFAISRTDLERLRALHLRYLRAMQDIIASSEPSECVGLFCVQLLDLGAEPAAC
jgi:hypothetical protein